MNNNRSCAWWFFGAMLAVPIVERLFTVGGYGFITAFTGPLPGVGASTVHLVAPVSLALGLVAMLVLFWFVTARRGAPAGLWLVPTAYALVRLGGVAVMLGQWSWVERGSDFLTPSALFASMVNGYPFVDPVAYFGSMIGYPLVAALGTWIGSRRSPDAIELVTAAGDA